jgi:hypothetical protein
MGSNLTGETEVLGENISPVPLCPPQIPCDLNWTGGRAATVQSRRLTAWATARPRYPLTSERIECTTKTCVAAHEESSDPPHPPPHTHTHTHIHISPFPIRLFKRHWPWLIRGVQGFDLSRDTAYFCWDFSWIILVSLGKCTVPSGTHDRITSDPVHTIIQTSELTAAPLIRLRVNY